MIRLLFVSTSSTLGGAEKTLFTLATRLDPRRFETAAVVSLKPRGEFADRLEAQGHAVRSLDGGSIPGPGALRRLAGIIREAKPDIVHALMYQAMQLSRAVKRWGSPGFKLVGSPRVHYRSRSRPSLWVDKLLRSQDDLTICESDSNRDYMTRRLGYDPARTATIHNGVEAPGELSADDRIRLRRELGAGPEDVLLGAVGRLDRQKGHAYLLEALAKLHVLHPVRCVIIGEGPFAPELERLARCLRVFEYARFMGRQRDLRPWYAAMDIFVLPSLWEGFPNSLLEAMAAGLAVVATKVDGVPEAVEHRSNGILCEPGNSQALFSAIQELILDPALRRRLGSAARGVSRRFSVEGMIEAYQGAYERLAGTGT